MKTKSWFSEDSNGKIARDIRQMIEEGKISEIISLSISCAMVATSVKHYAILIYKP